MSNEKSGTNENEVTVNTPKVPVKRGRRPGSRNKTQSKAALTIEVAALKLENSQLRSILDQTQQDLLKVTEATDSPFSIANG